MLDSGKLEKLGIDMEEGLIYCLDDPDFYEVMLREYEQESEKRLSVLQKSYEEHDWSRYAICAHSVKSTSGMIGAKKMAEQARIMEAAGKEGNGAAISAGHEQFLKEYSELARSLREMFPREWLKGKLEM